eukprot:SAG11_NODE_29992_length_305_cov_0.757282_1_plen_101_part_10
MRIAPPEAPKSGYRFGKGAYFADVIGKSASYCRTTGSNTMLIMACDVALGEEWQTKRDKYMTSPQGSSMCTHAMGVHSPDLAEAETIEDGTAFSAPTPAL